MNPHSFDRLLLAGKVAVVTGGTQGLGEAIAHLFAERGAAGLVICGRNRDKGERVAGALKAKGAEAIFVPADLAEVAACRQVIEAADRRFGADGSGPVGARQRPLPALCTGDGLGQELEHRIAVLAIVFAEPEFD